MLTQTNDADHQRRTANRAPWIKTRIHRYRDVLEKFGHSQIEKSPNTHKFESSDQFIKLGLISG